MSSLRNIFKNIGIAVKQRIINNAFKHLILAFFLF